MMRPGKRKEEKIKLTKDSYSKARKLFAYIKPYRVSYGIGWIFLVLSTSIGLIFPVLLGQLLGTSSGETTSLAEAVKQIDLTNLHTVAIALFVMFAAQAVFSYFRVVLFTNVTENMLRDIRNDVFGRLIELPLNYFNKTTVGEITSRLSSDITQLQETFRTTVAEFFRQIVMVVGGLFFMVFISWRLTLIMLATIPVIAIIAVFFGRFIRRLSKEAQDQTAEANARAEESFTGIANVKAFTNEAFNLFKFKKATQNIRDLNIKSGVWRGLFISFIVFCMFGSIVFIIWQGLMMTTGPNPNLATGDLYSFLMVTLMLAASIGSLPDFYASIQKSIGASEKLVDILHEEPESQIFKGKETPDIKGNLKFSNVSFSYPTRPDVEVLKSINFEIEANQTLALVGSSGGGKSTIANLVLSYYKINGGSIVIDGTDSREIDLKHLRKHIAVVPQEVLLFAGSIYDNILYGNPDATEEEVMNAAKQANAFDFIESFPEGFNTQVGERGIQLSGGQKQRIAIARAILKNPTILVLDEATSALDSESERVVQDALEKLMFGRTSIVIAHRLSTIRKADKILVLDKGEISQSGSHEELMANDGIYAELVKLQVSSF